MLSGVILLLNFVALADSDKTGVVTIVRLQGQAQYSLDGGTTWNPVLVGKYLRPGSLIRTGDDGIVDILVGQTPAEKNVSFLKINGKDNPAPNVPPLQEHNMIRLRPNTTLGIDKLLVPDADPTAISDAVLNLKKGRILASVRKVSPSSEYFVKIPNGVAAVRGTQLNLSSDGSGSSTCSVVNGTVWLSFTITDANGNPVSGPDGQPFPPIQVTINPGQTFSITPSLLGQLTNALKQAGAGTDIQTLINQLNLLANAAVETLDSGALDTLTEIMNSLTGLILTITGDVNPPYDNGTPPTMTHQ